MFLSNKKIEDEPETAAGFSTCSQTAETWWWFWDQKRGTATAFEPKLYLLSMSVHQQTTCTSFTSALKKFRAGTADWTRGHETAEESGTKTENVSFYLFFLK